MVQVTIMFNTHLDSWVGRIREENKDDLAVQPLGNKKWSSNDASIVTNDIAITMEEGENSYILRDRMWYINADEKMAQGNRHD